MLKHLLCVRKAERLAALCRLQRPTRRCGLDSTVSCARPMYFDSASHGGCHARPTSPRATTSSPAYRTHPILTKTTHPPRRRHHPSARPEITPRLSVCLLVLFIYVQPAPLDVSHSRRAPCSPRNAVLPGPVLELTRTYVSAFSKYTLSRLI